MNAKETQFVNYVINQHNRENAALLKSIVKGYIVVESAHPFLNKVKEFVHPSSRKDTAETIQKQPELSQEDINLIAADRTSFNDDYRAFIEACKMIVFVLKEYGNRMFNEYIRTPDFATAYKKGTHLDQIRRNPLTECIRRQFQFKKFLTECVSIDPDKTQLIHSIMEAYFATEAGHSFDTRLLFEGPMDDEDDMQRINNVKQQMLQSKYNEGMGMLRRAMLTVMRFMSNHGSLAWDKFRKTPTFYDVYNRSGEKNKLFDCFCRQKMKAAA